MLKFFDADPGSGIGSIRIRDVKNSDPVCKNIGSGINISATLQFCIIRSCIFSNEIN
jgi:hypothetical protein